MLQLHSSTRRPSCIESTKQWMILAGGLPRQPLQQGWGGGWVWGRLPPCRPMGPRRARRRMWHGESERANHAHVCTTCTGQDTHTDIQTCSRTGRGGAQPAGAHERKARQHSHEQYAPHRPPGTTLCIKAGPTTSETGAEPRSHAGCLTQPPAARAPSQGPWATGNASRVDPSRCKTRD